MFAERVCGKRRIQVLRAFVLKVSGGGAGTGGPRKPKRTARASATKGLKMNEQIETVVVELNLEDLDQVQGGLTCRKAGGTQEAAPTGGQDIIVVV